MLLCFSRRKWPTAARGSRAAAVEADPGTRRGGEDPARAADDPEAGPNPGIEGKAFSSLKLVLRNFVQNKMHR